MHSGHRHRWMWGKRRKREVTLDVPTDCTLYLPLSLDKANILCPEGVQDRIVLTYVELQALKLVYVDNMTHTEAAYRMGLPRSTFWRVLESGRRKLIQALVERKPILIASTEQGQC